MAGVRRIETLLRFADFAAEVLLAREVAWRDTAAASADVRAFAGERLNAWPRSGTSANRADILLRPDRARIRQLTQLARGRDFGI
jgi:hypothetical protein